MTLYILTWILILYHLLVVGAKKGTQSMKCKDCIHWIKSEDRHLGSCSRWLYGYGYELKDIPINEVLVEDDEGWGAMMGPEFGCVLWEAKE